MNLDDIEIFKKGLRFKGNKEIPRNLEDFMSPVVSYVDSFRNSDEINGDCLEVLRTVLDPFSQDLDNWGANINYAFFRLSKILAVNYGEIIAIGRKKMDPPLHVIGEVLGEIKKVPRNREENQHLENISRRYIVEKSRMVDPAGYVYDTDYYIGKDRKGRLTLDREDRKDRGILEIAKAYGERVFLDEELNYQGPIVRRVHILSKKISQLVPLIGVLGDEIAPEEYEEEEEKKYEGVYVNIRLKAAFPRNILWATNRLCSNARENGDYLIQGEDSFLRGKNSLSGVYWDAEILLYKIIRDKLIDESE